MLLSFWLNGQKISLPILEGPADDVMVLPARCQVVRKFRVRNYNNDLQLVQSQEIQKGIFVARTIIDSKEPLLKVLNTTDQAQVIKNNVVITENLSDYYIYN